MRLKGINNIKEANRFLAYFLPGHNKRFSIKPVKENNLHRHLSEDINLDTILCIKQKRTLRNDFTIAYKKRFYQVLDKDIGKIIEVQERINGSLHIFYREKRLRYKPIIIRQKQDKPKLKLKKIVRPSLEHPWKKASYDRMIFHKRYPL